MLRRIVQFATVIGAVCGVGVIGAGCLDRPVTSSGATTKTNFTASVTQNAIDKVDILFDIDNSASMGDKQAFLAAAVPDLITRLVQPNCVTSTTTGTGTSAVTTTTPVGLSTNGSCAAFTGSTIEFPPVHNMHIGVISSSLGSRGVTGGGEVCPSDQMTNNGAAFTNPPSPSISSHTDDQAHLLNRIPGAISSETEGTSPDTGGQNFLDWFPTGTGWAINDGKTAAPPGTSLAPLATDIMVATQLETDFTNLIIGAHFYGCGIESQLESWYRFLVQPDPYGSIVVGTNGLAQWSGVDATIIQQRHDFLRPDSLVAIIDLSDENDSEIDVRSFGGQGYKFMDQTFQPPRGTAICQTAPDSPMCTSCAYGTNKTDPSCMTNGGVYTAANDPGFYINVRHVHMQQKYGIVPQFPIGRYVLGLTSPTVPDRNTEYPPNANCYQGGIGTMACSNTPSTSIDASALNCTNPLFAATLPTGLGASAQDPTTLCNVAGSGGTRTASLIFYAHIGGVPHQLLQSKPGDATRLCSATTPAADCPQKDTLLPTDWVSILGQGWETLPTPAALTNPNQYNYTGIDPHMIEAFAPRPTIVDGPPTPGGGGPDLINGQDWVTGPASPQPVLPVDREYACIFPLATPRDCSDLGDYAAQEACDCSTPGLPQSPNAVPSVCGTQSGGPFVSGTNEYTKQYYAKAYPTIRETQLAELMGTQGILSSLCPIHTTDNSTNNDPLYGYRPAITSIVNRLKNALATQCLPEKLNPVPTGMGKFPNCEAPGANCEVECLILATLAPGVATNEASNETAACSQPAFGLSPPSTTDNGVQAGILKTFRAAQHATYVNPPNSGKGIDPSTLATCFVNQIPYSQYSSCATPVGSTKGWCYVTDTGTSCPQAIQFTPGSPPEGSVVSLQCIEAAPTIGGDGGGI
jgi:hypothetical protein